VDLRVGRVALTSQLRNTSLVLLWERQTGQQIRVYEQKKGGRGKIDRPFFFPGELTPSLARERENRLGKTVYALMQGLPAWANTRQQQS
jgi:hypothetical protein